MYRILFLHNYICAINIGYITCCYTRRFEQKLSSLFQCLLLYCYPSYDIYFYQRAIREVSEKKHCNSPHAPVIIMNNNFL